MSIVIVLVYLVLLNITHQSQMPTKYPTISPTLRPSINPTKKPTNPPTTKRPTYNPTSITDKPTKYPTKKPTLRPSLNPTKKPTNRPSKTPTKKPTYNPTFSTKEPTKRPTNTPTLSTSAPSKAPTNKYEAILTSAFCLTDSSKNVTSWIYFGISFPVCLILIFICMKYGIKLRMCSFCSIFGLLMETFALSLIIGGIIYTFQLYKYYKGFDCTHYSYEFIGAIAPFGMHTAYIITIVVGFIWFLLIFAVKLVLMKESQQWGDEFNHEYSKTHTDSNMIEKQCSKFCETQNLLFLLGKGFLFLVGFSLCISLQPLWGIGHVYNSDYLQINPLDCLCIEIHSGTAIKIYSTSVFIILISPITACFAYIVSKFDIDECGENCGCLGYIIAGYFYIMIAALIIFSVVFIVCSPFVLIYLRVKGIYEDIALAHNVNQLLSIQDITIVVFFIEMIYHFLHPCFGC